MTPTSNRLLCEWLPTRKIGRFYTSASDLDYWNTTDVKMFKVIAAGPGRVTRKGVFVANEIKPGDNVIVDGRLSRPEDLNGGKFLIRNPDEIVLAIVPVQVVGVDLAAPDA
jgi:co-chaperonin GroES (HSP10)